MAFDYSSVNTGVFYRLGKFIKKVNAYAATASTTYPADLKEIADPYEAADMTAMIDNLFSFYGDQQNAIVSLRQQLADIAERTLLDRTTILDQIGATQPNIDDVLIKLFQKMLDDAQTVDRSTVTLGSVVSTGNTGNGTVITTKVLDGFNAPLSGAQANLRYNSLDSELAVPAETMAMRCVADSATSGTPEGGEQFSWQGGVPNVQFDWITEGSGDGPTLTVANVSGLVTDGDFENWTNTNTPTNWTITDGTAGTHIFRESGASNIHRGTYSLKFLGTGAQATIGISQAIAPATLKAKRRYNVSLRIKASGVPAAGNINVLFTGTGYTASSSEKIDIAAASFPTAAFTAAGSLQNFFINMPAIIPADLKLTVTITGTLSNTVAVYFDSLAIKEVVYFGGVGAVLVAGSTRFILGDKHTFTVANDVAGVFQEYFRKRYKFQLPSLAVGETIDDALAT